MSHELSETRQSMPSVSQIIESFERACAKSFEDELFSPGRINPNRTRDSPHFDDTQRRSSNFNAPLLLPENTQLNDGDTIENSKFHESTEHSWVKTEAEIEEADAIMEGVILSIKPLLCLYQSLKVRLRRELHSEKKAYFNYQKNLILNSQLKSYIQNLSKTNRSSDLFIEPKLPVDGHLISSLDPSQILEYGEGILKSSQVDLANLYPSEGKERADDICSNIKKYRSGTIGESEVKNLSNIMCDTQTNKNSIVAHPKKDGLMPHQSPRSSNDHPILENHEMATKEKQFDELREKLASTQQAVITLNKKRFPPTDDGEKIEAVDLISSIANLKNEKAETFALLNLKRSQVFEIQTSVQSMAEQSTKLAKENRCENENLNKFSEEIFRIRLNVEIAEEHAVKLKNEVQNLDNSRKALETRKAELEDEKKMLSFRLSDLMRRQIMLAHVRFRLHHEKLIRDIRHSIKTFPSHHFETIDDRASESSSSKTPEHLDSNVTSNNTISCSAFNDLGDEIETRDSRVCSSKSEACVPQLHKDLGSKQYFKDTEVSREKYPSELNKLGASEVYNRAVVVADQNAETKASQLISSNCMNIPQKDPIGMEALSRMETITSTSGHGENSGMQASLPLNESVHSLHLHPSRAPVSFSDNCSVKVEGSTNQLFLDCSSENLPEINSSSDCFSISNASPVSPMEQHETSERKHLDRTTTKISGTYGCSQWTNSNGAKTGTFSKKKKADERNLANREKSFSNVLEEISTNDVQNNNSVLQISTSESVPEWSSSDKGKSYFNISRDETRFDSVEENLKISSKNEDSLSEQGNVASLVANWEDRIRGNVEDPSVLEKLDKYNSSLLPRPYNPSSASGNETREESNESLDEAEWCTPGIANSISSQTLSDELHDSEQESIEGNYAEYSHVCVSGQTSPRSPSLESDESVNRIPCLTIDDNACLIIGNTRELQRITEGTNHSLESDGDVAEGGGGDTGVSSNAQGGFEKDSCKLGDGDKLKSAETETAIVNDSLGPNLESNIHGDQKSNLLDQDVEKIDEWNAAVETDTHSEPNSISKSSNSVESPDKCTTLFHIED